MEFISYQTLQRGLTLLALSLFLAISGCAKNEGKRSYMIDEVQTRVVIDDTTQPTRTYIVFGTLMETQYFSPGVKVKRDKENNVRIRFVRAGIRDKLPAVDLKAEYLTKWLNENNLPTVLKEKILRNSTSAEQILVLSGDVRNIYVTDGQSEKNAREKW